MAQNTSDDIIPDRIAETFAGRKILLTGGTGFLGKVMLEKLLRCLPDIAQIYMLIRPKKDKDPKHRLDEILNSLVSYDNLLPHEISKVYVYVIFFGISDHAVVSSCPYCPRIIHIPSALDPHCTYDKDNNEI